MEYQREQILKRTNTKDHQTNHSIIKYSSLNYSNNNIPYLQLQIFYIYTNYMEPESKENDLRKELLSMDFPLLLVQQALQFTNNKEAAINYIVEALEDMDKFNIKSTQQQHNNEENSSDYEDVEEACKMVFLVRMDLKMGLGKMAAQTGHAVLGAYKKMQQKSQHNENAQILLLDWMQNGSKKIALKVQTQAQILSLVQKAKEQNVNYYLVHDAGKTQIAAGSLTVCALGPQKDEVLDKITGHLKLL